VALQRPLTFEDLGHHDCLEMRVVGALDRDNRIRQTGLYECSDF
jgi:hypothetical protein